MTDADDGAPEAPLDPPPGANASEDGQIQALLLFLKDVRGVDFTGYKLPSLLRRIRRRMEHVKVARIDDYQDYLQVHPDEFAQLVDTILINVTGFFRDADAWQYLQAEVVPAICGAGSGHDPIRIWSAGCSSGEEAYSLAMAFADHLGVDEFKERVKIYATDVDDAALAVARAGTYTAKQLEGVSPDRLARYFTPVSGEPAATYQFRPDCRRSVIFGHLDVTRDAPISRLDLLVCRNLLMYLVADTQRRVLRRFRHALTDHGFLFLGKAETMFTNDDLFQAVSPRHRVFRRDSGVPVAAIAATAPLDLGAPIIGQPASGLEDLALAATPVAQFVLDLDGLLVGANAQARAMFGITSADLGRPFHELGVSGHPVDLVPRIAQAFSEHRPVRIPDVKRLFPDGELQFLEVSIAPLVTPAGQPLGASITFLDVTELGRLRLELERSSIELRGSNRQLQLVNQRLETANEELQSANEELETTNEELQSANEELETMNEELQSANQELETLNHELVRQAGEIEQGKTFLASILGSLTVGVAVVDTRLDVVTWNRAAEDLWGLRSEEAVGRSFLALDIGLPVAELAPMLRSMAAGVPTHAVPVEQAEQPDTVVAAVDRKGRDLRCRVVVRPLADGSTALQHRIILMDPLPDSV